MASLVLVAVFIVIPSAVATPQPLQLAPISASPIAVERDIAATTDSKGRIHAAWVEQTDGFSGSRNASLWYSMYDPENLESRTAHLLDSSSSIYSLAMSIDMHDNVHMVWVKAFANTAPVRQLPSQIYYLNLDTTTASSASPKLILSRADPVWASVTLVYESQPYVAWTETVRLSTKDTESTTYYSRLQDDAANITPMPVTRTAGFSRILKATSVADSDTLYLAWVDELSERESRVMCSKVDVSKNTATTTNIHDVNATIGRLALSRTRDGDVAIGWLYREPSRNEPVASAAKLSREGNDALHTIEIRSRYRSDPESMRFDPEGNLQFVWLEYDNEVRAGLGRPIRVSQPTLHYVKFSISGKPSQERREISYLWPKTVFVLDDGRLYVISIGGLLESAKATSSSDSIVLLVAAIAVASVVSGMSTEAGVYFRARWTARSPWSKRDSVPVDFSDFDTKLLRRIRRQPGITLCELRGFGQRDLLTVASCLRKLEALGSIWASRDGTRQRFYSAATESHADRIRESILRRVRDVPGITEARIARCFGLSQQLANYHLGVLRRARLLSSVRIQGKVGYFVNKLPGEASNQVISPHLGEPAHRCSRVANRQFKSNGVGPEAVRSNKLEET